MDELSEECRKALISPDVTGEQLDAILTAEFWRRMEPYIEEERRLAAEEHHKLMWGDPTKARPMGMLNFPRKRN